MGFNASDPLFDTAEETGGSKDAVLVEHTHTLGNAGAHTHTISFPSGGGAEGGTPNGLAEPLFRLKTYVANTTSAGAHTHSISTEGQSGTNANLQPYITVYMWKRTA